MNECTRFENGLADLLAGETDGASVQTLRERLRQHAAVCAECGASSDLLAFASLPRDRRETFEMPDEAYWGDFRHRVRARALGGRSAAAFPMRRAIAAALIVVGLVAGWLLRSGWERTASPSPTANVDWGQLDEAIRQATPEEREALLRTLLRDDGFGTLPAVGWTASIDERDFDEAERARLDEWLDDNEL